MKRMLMDNCAEECKLQRTKECQEIHLFYDAVMDASPKGAVELFHGYTYSGIPVATAAIYFFSLVSLTSIPNSSTILLL